jgi:hypothetical protein
MAADPTQRRWIPIAIAIAGLALVVVADWNRYDNVTVASNASAHHPASIRWTIHLATIAVLLVLGAVRRAPPAALWGITALLFGLNTLATSRFVMGKQLAPRLAVAGVELDRTSLRHNRGYYAAWLCFESFARTERSVEIDGRSLSPPFLPLPVDWSDVDVLVPEMTCIDVVGDP